MTAVVLPIRAATPSATPSEASPEPCAPPPSLTMDRNELDIMLREQLPGIRRAIYRYVGPDPELDDLVQVAMVEVVRSIHSFRGDSKLSTWIHRVCIRVAWAHRERRKGVLRFAVPPEDVPDRVHGVPRLENRDALKVVERCLDQLSTERRMAFLLYDVEGYSAPEISEMLDIPEGTIYYRVREARLALRKVLASRTPLPARGRERGGQE